MAEGVKLAVDDRQSKPFSCSQCGRDYEPCYHWEEASEAPVATRWQSMLEECERYSNARRQET